MVAYLFGELVKGWEGIFPFFLRNVNTLSDHFAYNHPESLNLGRIIESFKIFNVFACKFHLLQEVAEILQTDCVIRSSFWPSCQLPLKISTDYGSRRLISCTAVVSYIFDCLFVARWDSLVSSDNSIHSSKDCWTLSTSSAINTNKIFKTS